MSRVREHWKPLLGVASAGLVPLLILFWVSMGENRLYFGHDIGLQQFALTAQARESLAAWELPFWNPRIFAGTPHLAPANGGVLSPAWLATAWLPLGPSFVIHAVLSLWLAYAGAAWCAWRRTRTVGGAILAGYAFMLGAPVFLRVFAGHTTILGCAWAIPWLFAAGDALLERVRGASLLAVAAMTAVLLIGNPHLAMLSVLAFAAAVAGRVALRWRADRDTKRWGATLAWIAGAGMCGVLLAMPQLLPGFEFAPHSSRAGGLELSVAKTGSAGLNHLPYFLLPAYYGDPSHGDANVLAYPAVAGAHAPTVWEVCGYLGVVPLALCAVAWSVKRGKTYGAVAALTLGLALAHHLPLYTIAYYVVPEFDLLRTPGRWLMITSFALAICAAEGYALLQRDDDTGVAARRRLRWVAGGLALVAIIVATTASGVPNGFGSAGPAINVGVPAASYALLGVAVLVVAALAVAAARAPGLAQSLAPGLVVVTLIELYLFCAPFVRAEPFSEHRWPAAIADTATRLGKGWRFEISQIGAVDWIRGNHPPMHGLNTAGGYDPAVLRHYMQLYNTVQGHPVNQPTWVGSLRVPESGETWSRLLPLLHMRYVVTKHPSLPRPMRVVTQDAGIHIYEYPHPLPRAYLVHLTRVVDDSTPETELAPLTVMGRSDFALREEAVVSAGGPALNRAPPEAPETVTVVEETPHRIVLDVEVAADGLLVLLDNWYPGWSCTVDGTDAPIHRTNHAFRGVEVKRGHRTVVFTYRCAPFTTGLMIALLTLCGLGGAGWWLRTREPVVDEGPSDAE